MRKTKSVKECIKMNIECFAQRGSLIKVQAIQLHLVCFMTFTHNLV